MTTRLPPSTTPAQTAPVVSPSRSDRTSSWVSQIRMSSIRARPATRKRPTSLLSQTGRTDVIVGPDNRVGADAFFGSDAVQELEHPLGEQRGGLRVVRGKRAVREVVLVARVEEELRVLDLLDDLAGGLDVTFANEDRVVVRAVDLDRDAVRPWSEGPLAADRDRGIEEQRAAGTWSRLGELLGHHFAE